MSLSQRIGFAYGAVSGPLHQQPRRAPRGAIALKASPNDSLSLERYMTDDFVAELNDAS